MSEEGRRFCDPVTVPGVPGVLERAVVVQKIRGKVKFRIAENYMSRPANM